MANIQQIVEVMQACNRQTYMYVYNRQLNIIYNYVLIDMMIYSMI